MKAVFQSNDLPRGRDYYSTIQEKSGKSRSDEHFVLDITHTALSITATFCSHTQIGNVNRNTLRPGTFPTA